MKRTEQIFWLDLFLFMTFLLIIFTGLILWLVVPARSAAPFLGLNRHFWQTMHFFASMVSVTGIAFHITWHKTWLKALRNRPVTFLTRKVKANRVVDRIIWITFLAASVFGILGWFIQNEFSGVNIFSRLHVVLVICWLMGIVVHLVFHRKWISSSINRNFLNKTGNVEKHAGLAKE